MKITYPECQIEISTEEIIDLLNHFVESTSSRQHEIQEDPSIESTSSRQHESTEVRKSLYKTICCPECGHKFKEEVPDFMNGEFATICPNCGTRISGVRAGNEIVIMTLPPKEQEDEQPAPKPYPNLTDNEAIVQHGEGFLHFIKQGLEEAEAQGKLPEELTQVEIPKEENTPVEIPIERKNESTKKKKASSKPQKVEILFETGWKTFDSVSEAAEALGVNYKTFYHNLTHGKPCKKHQVRYANPELDASLAEIKERDRQPYQPSKPIR